MAITLFTGLMGHGKSYEVTATVLLEALAQGRDVYAYFFGLNAELIAQYIEKTRKVAKDKQGAIYQLSRDDLYKDNLYPADGVIDPIVKPGSLVIIDEAQKFYDPDYKMLPSHKNFLTEHRHVVHPETGVSCDIVFITQDIQNLNKFIRGLVELTFKCTKLKSLGLANSYRIEWWEGGKGLYKFSRVGVQNRNFKKDIFPLYKSYDASGAAGKELQVDKRQNIFRNPIFIASIIAVPLIAVFAINHVYRYFNPESLQLVEGKTATQSSSAPIAAPAAHAANAVVTQAWRIVGYYTVDGVTYSLVQDTAGNQRYQSVGGGSHLDGLRSSIAVDSAVATFNSVAVATATSEKNRGFLK